MIPERLTRGGRTCLLECRRSIPWTAVSNWMNGSSGGGGQRKASRHGNRKRNRCGAGDRCRTDVRTKGQHTHPAQAGENGADYITLLRVACRLKLRMCLWVFFPRLLLLSFGWLIVCKLKLWKEALQVWGGRLLLLKTAARGCQSLSEVYVIGWTDSFGSSPRRSCMIL